MLKNEDITTVFTETYPHLCRFLQSIVGGHHAAQDIAQESFMRLCQAELGEISTTEIRFWLFRVARNLALNELDKGKTRSKLWMRVTEVFRIQEPSVAETLERLEQLNKVRELLDYLPENQRSALLLREQEEMSYREIALVLGIAESRVKIDIFRARRRLRDLWNEKQEKSRC